MPKFVDDDRFVDHLDVASGEPFDEFPSLPFPVAFRRLVRRLDCLLVRVDRAHITSERDALLESSVSDVPVFVLTSTLYTGVRTPLLKRVRTACRSGLPTP